MQFRTYSAWDELPAGYDALFAGAGAQDLCLGRAWFEALAATTLAPEERLVLAGVEEGDRPSACLVGRHRERDPAFFGARSLCSLSNFYTLRYAPILADDGGHVALAALIRGLRARRPRYAAQLWIVWHGRAILYKLAHDRSCAALSPGTVLTMRVLERLLDEERVGELDLGAGDDAYKQLWASRRRPRCGLLAFDPLTLRGAAGTLRHAVLPRLKQAQDHLRRQST
jgi:hypothetical protein